MLGLVLLETLLCGYLLVLSTGMNNTPQETTDSTGAPIGFNNRLSWEHFNIALSNAFTVRPGHFHEYMAGLMYEGLLFAMCILGVWLLSTEAHWRWRITKWFFAGQIVWMLYWAIQVAWSDGKPLRAFVAPFYMFLICWQYIRGPLDFEDFHDGSVVWFVVYPMWLVTALGIAFYHGSTVRRDDRPNGQMGEQKES